MLITKSGAFRLLLSLVSLFGVCNGFDVWLTAGDQSRLLAKQASLSGSSTSYPGIREIAVTTTGSQQSILGFGAAFSNAAASLIYYSPNRDEILQQLFAVSYDQQGGIGIETIRLVMGGSDFNAVNPYTYNDVSGTDFSMTYFSIDKDREFVLPLLKLAKAVNPNLKIVATPWSAPAWMKTNNNLFGGSLIDSAEYMSALGDYFVRFVQAYAAEGIAIDYLTVQNEPLHETNTYPSMYMWWQQQSTFIRDFLGPKFRQAGLSTRIIIYDHNWDDTGFSTGILSDSQTAQYVAGSGWHCYAGDKNSPGTVRQQFPDKDIFFTECSGGEWDTNFASVLGWNTQNLFIGQTRVGARTVLLWNMALDENNGPTVGVSGGCTNCRGILTVTGSGYQKNVEFYTIGHFSKFVRQGAVMLSSTTYENDVETAAFRNPDGKIVVVVLNASWDTAATFQLVVDGTYYLYENLPPRSVVSFVK